MNEDVQVIAKDGRPEYAVIPYAEYERLREACEELGDVRAYDEAKRAAESEETVPGEILDRLLDGESPVKVWRDFRGMKQNELAAKAGITPGYLSQIEAKKKEGPVTLYVEFARALDVTVDELVGWKG